MPDLPQVGWCANVLAVDSIVEMVAAIEATSAALPPKTPVGLWLTETMLKENVQPLQQWLRQSGCPLIGVNAFPQGAFHEPIIKDAVYLPDWSMQERLDYTVDAAIALAELLGRKGEGGLTTVPIGWPAHDIDIDAAADNIRLACEEIEKIADATGTRLHLAIEPEPGCILQTANELANFVLNHKLDDLARRGLLRACLDACHLAVMHESSSEAIATLEHADVSIGRLQLSSAPEARGEHYDELLALAEPRWMHQTSIDRDGTLTLVDDLPDTQNLDRSGTWRTHLHVPIHLEHIGPLRTTQRAITELLAAAAALPYRPVVEIETYAWSVLPDSARCSTLGDDIAAELRWAAARMREVNW
ncbi:MAG: metabolite traffic protein EboE [Phycisphaerales bacterium]|nr:metabolite traffic protein EboE [Phycisphaerales bacterium]